MEAKFNLGKCLPRPFTLLTHSLSEKLKAPTKCFVFFIIQITDSFFLNYPVQILQAEGSSGRPCKPNQ